MLISQGSTLRLYSMNSNILWSRSGLLDKVLGSIQDSRVVGSSPGRAIVFAFLGKMLNSELSHLTQV
jgi:hypothetical protein